jgi:hypothetical protein
MGDDALYIYDVGLSAAKLAEVVPWEDQDFSNTVAKIIVKDCSSKPVLILYDKVEQHYRKERIPKVGLLDRSNVLKRKLQVVFPQYNVRAALKIKAGQGRSGGAQSAAASGGLYLMSAIPGNEHFKKVIEAVRQSMAPVAGFCLLPVESSDMVRQLADKLSKKAGGKAKWVVFMGQHQNGSLRQIVIKEGDLALTRMTPITDTEMNAKLWTDEIVQEFKATMSYLSRFGYSSDDGLEVIIISNHECGDLLSESIETSCNLTTMTVNEAARALGLSIGRQEEDRYADVLHAAWAGKKRRFLLPMRAKQLENIHGPRMAAMLLMVLLTVGMFYMFWQAFISVQDILAIQDKLEGAYMRKNQMEAQYREEVERKDAMGFDVELVQGTLQAYSRLEKMDLQPLDLFKKMGQSLGPDLTLDQLSVRKRYEDNDERSYGRSDQPDEKIFLEAVFSMILPSSLGPSKANMVFENLRDRLQQKLVSADVIIKKLPYDTVYNVEVTGESGVVRGIEEEEDYTPEMIIRRRVQ